MKTKESNAIIPKSIDKVIAIKVNIKTHSLIKALAKFKGIKIQDLGSEALTDYIEYCIEHDIKGDVADLRTRIRAANEIIKTK
jgi:hypothetical protein